MLSNLKTNTITHQKNQEMKTSDVILCIATLNKIKLNYLSKDKGKITNCTERNKINMLKELYKRLIVPFYIPILMLIPYLLILSSKEKSNYKKMQLFSFIIGVTIIIFSETIIRFISKEINENIFIFIIPSILFLFFYLIFFYKLKLKSIS